jgi:CubicO group peptidase (beta-lactamase class C family)
LSGIIEKASGLSCQEYFEQHLFTSLGLDSTFNCLQHFEEIAQGYRIAGRTLMPVPSYNPSRLLGATGLCSTAGDLIKWQRGLAEGRVVSPETFRQMIAPTRLLDGSTVPYGYGLGLDNGAIAHGGQTAGFRSLLVHFPEDDLTIVLLSNTDVPANYSLETLADVIATRILGAPEG